MIISIDAVKHLIKFYRNLWWKLSKTMNRKELSRADKGHQQKMDSYHNNKINGNRWRRVTTSKLNLTNGRPWQEMTLQGESKVRAFSLLISFLLDAGPLHLLPKATATIGQLSLEIKRTGIPSLTPLNFVASSQVGRVMWALIGCSYPN